MAFSPQTLEFLGQAPFEDRAWLKANRARYEEQVLAPQKALVAELAPYITTLAPGLEGVASRIYRDARFQRGGPSLRGNIWITFHDRSLDPGERPGFFFELYPDRYRYGMGFYQASREKADRIRAAIDADPQRFARVVAALPESYELMGDLYKKSRAGHLPERLRSWYDRKTFWIQVQRPNDDLVLGPGLAEHLRREWGDCAELYQYIVQA